MESQAAFDWFRDNALWQVPSPPTKSSADSWPKDNALLQVRSPFTKSSADSVVLEKVSLGDVGDDPLATCNDGSPGIFYWAPASTESRSWLVLLGYGGWCWDAASCKLRSPRMTSSTDYADLMYAAPGGILGETSFNRVWAPHCSSDAWMGDVGANESVAGENWRGARIMRSIMRHLTTSRGLADGDTLVFGGLSAGSRGAMVHLDRLKSERLIPQGVRLMGYFDSPYYVEMEAFVNRTDIWHRVVTQTKQMAVSLQNEAILRGSGACNLPEAWQCAFGEFRLQVLKTPFLVVASQYDMYGLTVAEGSSTNVAKCHPDPQCPYYSYAYEFAGVTRQGLQNLARQANGSVGVFSSTCYNHARSLWEEHTKETVGGISRAEIFRQAVQSFDSGGAAMPLAIETSCTGLDCGSGCLTYLTPPEVARSTRLAALDMMA